LVYTTKYNNNNIIFVNIIMHHHHIYIYIYIYITQCNMFHGGVHTNKYILYIFNDNEV